MYTANTDTIQLKFSSKSVPRLAPDAETNFTKKFYDATPDFICLLYIVEILYWRLQY